MDLKTLKCPNCNANLSVPNESDKITCTHCGNDIVINKSEQNQPSEKQSDNNSKETTKIEQNNITFVVVKDSSNDDYEEDDSYNEDKQENQKQNVQPKNKFLKYLKANLGFVILLTIFCIMLISFLVTIGEVSKTGNSKANDALVGSGFAYIILFFILGSIHIHTERYKCPACGAKREHHREWVRTTEHRKTDSLGYTITYKHEYLDTYICPECGETMKEKVIKSGGTYNVNQYGIHDRRQSPNEF